MAFGFGFNKQKALNAAEKFVQQGKLQNAIAEYEKVLKADPKDLTVMNTVGDLYSRLGQSEQAVECFKSVGDAYASQGFTVKAIAMYKKLSKLKPSLDSVLRLAELYTQQGLFNDARAQYRQVAEEFLRTGELEQAARIFQKTLEMDPENVAMRTRLAEVYLKIGKKAEAWQILSEAAETLRSRGATAPAEEILQKMLTLDPGNSGALLLRARIAFESGDLSGAIQNLEKIADLDSHPDGLRILMQSYVRTGRFPEAETLAAKLVSVHNDVDSVLAYTDALISSGQFEDALRVFHQYSDRLLGTNSGRVLETVHSCIGHVRDNPAALETALDLLNKAGENTHLAEVYELLAHAYVQAGELTKARDYYLKLTKLEPQNQLHARSYQQVVAQLGEGSASSQITAEEGSILIEELEATAPFIDQRYSDEVSLAVRAALTDAELFISYNMPGKALEPLLGVLPKAFSDLRLNQRLAALYTRAGRFTEAAKCCRTLESLYHDAGYPEEAKRYGELAGKYEARTAEQAAEAGAPEELSVVAQPELHLHVEPAAESAFSSMPVEPPVVEEPKPEPPPAPAPQRASGLFWHAPAKPAAPPVSEPVMHVQPPAEEGEIDLSDEWEGATEPASTEEAAFEVSAAHEESSEPEPWPSSDTAANLIEEIRFYVSQSMLGEARSGLHKLEQLKAEASTLAELRKEIEAAERKAEPKHAASIEDEAEGEEIEVEEHEAEAPAPFAAKPSHPAAPVAASSAKTGSLKEFASDLESSLDGDFFPEAPIAVPAPEPQHLPQAAAHAPAAVESKSAPLSEFVADLESSLGDSFLAAAPVPQPEVPSPAARPAAAVKEAKPKPAPAFAASAAMQSPAASAAAAAPAPAHEVTPAASTFTYQTRPVANTAGASAAASAVGVDLSDMFGELKQELEADATAEEDCETHYNLGVAFREMGLLDEAIGEFQKVCQAADRGQKFSQLMQAYTWLAQCFLDKGVPEAAVRWYERALKLPNLDGDTCLALHYELASSYEAANNRPAALNHFLEVYGSNIDYRDVAERIKALKS